ncbi:MAG: rhodanese-like domain-containing protein, partial [Bdellovibrionia bacterium]
ATNKRELQKDSLSSTEKGSASVKVASFYRFGAISEIADHRQYFKELCLRLSMKGTILLSPEGINATVVGTVEAIDEFQGVLAKHPLWSGLEYKESFCHKIPYTRMLVKVKKEIIPIGDMAIKPAEWTAPRLSPLELKRWLDEGREITLVDTRNEYEIQHGTFENALTLGLDHFREIPAKLEALPDDVKTRPMVMFCTGGIRCEKASVVANQKGIKNVFQLDGGILKYFEQCGDSHYKGDCFVFDYRIAVDKNLKPVNLKTVDLQSANYQPLGSSSSITASASNGDE